jgi:hypothetical protein
VPFHPPQRAPKTVADEGPPAIEIESVYKLSVSAFKLRVVRNPTDNAIVTILDTVFFMSVFFEVFGWFAVFY